MYFASFDHLFPFRHISDLIPSMRNGLISSLFPLLLVPLLPTPSLAPVPRCGPLIIINKVPESLSLISDLNPFFPVPPCEYGGPLQALRAGDYESVFGGLPGQLDHIPLFPRGELAKHNLLEGIHILNKVAPRVAMWLRGEGDLKVAFFLFCPQQLMTMIILNCPNTMIQCLLLEVNWDILTEGYTHHTKEPRTIQFGHKTHRDPSLLLDDKKFARHAGGMLDELYAKAPLLKTISKELAQAKKKLLFKRRR